MSDLPQDGAKQAASAQGDAAGEQDATDRAAQSGQSKSAAESAGQAGPGSHQPKSTGEMENLLDDTEAAVSQAQIDALLGSSSEATPAQSSGRRRDDQPAKPPPEAASYQLDELQGDSSDDPPHGLDLLGDVELDLHVELGRVEMRLEDVLRLRGGAVVALDKLAGDPVDIFVNGQRIARGEVLVMNDNFCVRVTELVGGAVNH